MGLGETAAEARARGAQVTTDGVDLADREAVDRWAGQVVREHGRVNLVFNDAGVALGSTIEGMRYEDFEWLTKINFWGVIHGTKAFLPHLKASGDGHIVNISSIFGLAAMPTRGAYNAAKFAVRASRSACGRISRCSQSEVWEAVHHEPRRRRQEDPARSREELCKVGNAVASQHSA